MLAPPPSFEAWIALLSPASGGRHHPVVSGYRADWRLGRCKRFFHLGRWHDTHSLNGGPIQLVGSDEIPPGGRGTVLIWPLAPEFWAHLEAGAVLEMCEGGRVVAVGTVTKVIGRP